MNVEIIKKDLEKKVGQNVRVTVYGLRNKIERYEGRIYKIYPNIFTILYEGDEKSFTYRDIITKDINVKFL
ncbi:MAG: hypothetical protein E7167_04635 [Firmicutes bacterium]|nr:hypothetical protein [Bacillota bacterium]